MESTQQRVREQEDTVRFNIYLLVIPEERKVDIRQK